MIRRQARSLQTKRMMREKSKTSEPTFALTADVTEAHRQIPIVEQDWHLLGCQVQPGGEVFANTVGTFGVASASYSWSRVGSAIGRLCQYISGTSARTWHLLVADDYHLDAGGPRYRESIIVFFGLCSVLGVPVSSRKTSGGDTVSWVDSNHYTGHTRLACPREGRNGFRNGPEGSQILASYMCQVSKQASAV